MNLVWDLGRNLPRALDLKEGSEREGEHPEILTRPVVDPPATGGGGDGAKISEVPGDLSDF
jgi:hypothetical protein